jgi:hypothetical protein
MRPSMPAMPAIPAAPGPGLLRNRYVNDAALVERIAHSGLFAFFHIKQIVFLRRFLRADQVVLNDGVFPQLPRPLAVARQFRAHGRSAGLQSFPFHPRLLQFQLGPFVVRIFFGGLISNGR